MFVCILIGLEPMFSDNEKIHLFFVCKGPWYFRKFPRISSLEEPSTHTKLALFIMTHFSGIKLTSILLTQTWWQNKSSYTLKNSRLDMESMENQQLHNCYLNQ